MTYNAATVLFFEGFPEQNFLERLRESIPAVAWADVRS